MDELMNQMLEQFEAGLKAKALTTVKVLASEKNNYALELNRKEVSKMIGIDPKTFDERFRSLEDFPIIKTGGRDKYPRDAVIDWYQKNWQRTGV